VSGRISQEYQNVDQTKTRFVCKELRRSVFERMTYLPNYVKGDPEATMSKGILKLVWKLPKEKKPETKKIEIKSFE
jgi:HSP20 family molecular chaperone IbpA